MKITWIILAVLGTLVAVSVFGVHSCQRAGWESSLLGPYVGVPFTGNLMNGPTSVLAIPSHGELQIYEHSAHSAPVLVFRSEAGEIQWAQLLLPERRLDGGGVERAGVRELQLKKLERANDGHEVFFTCDWDWGGREGGLIDLDPDYEFRSFRISW